uniref:DM2 domain-containing protein n=1 Tax=viral metagenome TaxID=1070528 RepID=A0A6C0CHG9_9ZZZZ
MSKKTTAAPAAAAPAPATESAPVKTPRATKKAAAEVTVPVVEVATPAAEPVATETRSASVILSSLQESLKALSTEWSGRVRALVAEAGEAIKALKRDARSSKRRVRKDPSEMTAEEKAAWEARRANNAFLKLRPITDELASFMGLPAKSQKSQTDVTKFISNYVKEKQCFDPKFKRRIIPDAKLAKLLRVKDGEEVTYLNLQTFLKVHFIKPTA